MFQLHWVCVGNWNCRVLALRKDSAKAFVHEFALHFLMEHNGAWCTYDRVLPTRWCKHTKISQKWKHQNWIKWAYISVQVSTQESTSVWRKPANHKPIFSSPGSSEQSFLLSSPIREGLFSCTWSLAGFPSMLFIEAGIWSIWRLELSVLKRVVRGMADICSFKRCL